MKKLCFMLFCAVLGVNCTFGAEAADILYAMDFNKGGAGWNIPKYWNGKLEIRKGMARLTPTRSTKGEYGRMLASMPIQKKPVAGKKLIFRANLRGEGSAKLGVLVYSRNAKGKTSFVYEWSEPVTLTEKYRQHNLKIDLTKRAPSSLALTVQVDKGTLECTKLRLLAKTDEKIRITPEPVYQAMRKGDAVPPVTFRVEGAKEAVVFLPSAPASDRALPLTPDDKGVVTVPAKELSVTAQPYAVQCAAGGMTGSAYIDLVPAKVYDKLDAQAKKIRFDSPRKLLLFGDSLMDFDRGCNAATQLSYWLNKYNPGKVELKNVAVRGDYILRVEDRLNGKPKTFEPRQYDGIKDFKADTIFILLGHNDTRCTSLQNFEKPLVSPAEQEAAYRRVLARLRQNWPEARIVLLSSTSSDSERFHIKALQALKLKKTAVRFGDPDKMEAFNAVLKKLAAELKLEYHDVYTPMKGLSDKASLLRDGVHLSPAGYNYLAGELLRYFAK